jgi:hypothetical protein
MSQTPQMPQKDIAVEILNNVYDANIDVIKSLMEDYIPMEDTKYSHPILCEIAHQAGRNVNPHHDENAKNRIQRQNELFKYLWCHPKMISLRHNQDYRDKYDYTALERLRSSYDHYCVEMKNFVKEHICQDIEMVKTITTHPWSRRSVDFENTEHFGKLLTKSDVVM